jgi:hypothetical protein
MGQKRMVILIGGAVESLCDPIRIGFAAGKHTGQVTALHTRDRPGMKIRNHPATNDSETVTAFFCHDFLL